MVILYNVTLNVPHYISVIYYNCNIAISTYFYKVYVTYYILLLNTEIGIDN